MSSLFSQYVCTIKDMCLFFFGLAQKYPDKPQNIKIVGDQKDVFNINYHP